MLKVSLSDRTSFGSLERRHKCADRRFEATRGLAPRGGFAPPHHQSRPERLVPARVKGRGFHTPCTPVGYLTKVIPVVGFPHGTGWEADDRQGDWGGVVVRPAALSLASAIEARRAATPSARFTKWNPLSIRSRPSLVRSRSPSPLPWWPWEPLPWAPAKRVA